jgi:hypothetical protein
MRGGRVDLSPEAPQEEEALMPGRHARTACAAALLPASALLPAALPAQSRFGGALAAVASQPLGDFRQNAKWGFGGDGAVTLAVDRRGILALRGEGSIVGYSAGRRAFAAVVGFGTQVVLEEEARNHIDTWSLGPQLTVPVGPVRPYAVATVGLAHFSTATTIRVPAYETSTGRAETIDARTNFSHTAKTVGGVGGVLIPLAGVGLDLGSAMLDVGVRYQRNPRAQFVRPGDVQLNATTSPDIRTSAGEANVLSYRLGVAARFD